MPPPDCPFCEHQNPAGAKFCNACGSPLHLTPCGDCGAVNNLADPQCWRCGGVLLPLDSPVPAARFERELAVPAMPTEEELEQELVALEQEVEALERAPGSAAAPPPAVEHGFRGSSIPGPKAVDPRPRTAAPAFRGSNIPEPRTLFVREEDASWRRRRGLVVAAFVVALGSAIAVGAYLRDRDGASPDTAASAAPPSEMRAEPSTAPRVASGVAEAPGAVPATSPAPKALDAPIERRLASDAGEAPAVPAPAAAPDPSCPPAVEAMALCEWLVRANGQ
ncbi:MAG: zinc ribbon domain-containing protein [Burkholderiales bacterium]